MKTKWFGPCEWLVCSCGRCRQRLKHIRAFWGTSAKCANCKVVWVDWDIRQQVWVFTGKWWNPLSWGKGYFKDTPTLATGLK